MNLSRFVVVCFALCSLLTFAVETSKAVKVNIHSVWNPPSVAVEFIESLVDVDRSSLVAGLDCAFTYSQTHDSVHSFHHNIISECMGHYESVKVALVTLMMSTHARLPTIEAFYDHYQSVAYPFITALPMVERHCSSCWALLGISVMCPHDDLLRFDDIDVGSSNNIQLPFDHIILHPPGLQPSGILVLYADFSKECQDFLQNLKLFAAQKHLLFVLRWNSATRTTSTTYQQSKLHMSGYGVEMIIKSSEYMVVDDSELDDVEIYSDDQQFGSDTDHIAYHHLPSLVTRSVNIISDLEWLNFTEKLKEISSYMKIPRPLRKGKLADIGFRAAAFVLGSPLPLASLRSVMCNFPQFAIALDKQDVPTTLKSEIGRNQFKLRTEGGSGSRFFVNGLEIPLNKIDIFRIIRCFVIENEAVESLMNLGFSANASRELLYAAYDKSSKANGQIDQNAYDLHSDTKTEKESEIMWWNNLERDKRYSQWPSALASIFQETGGLPKIRRNLVNAIFALDLACEEGLRALETTLKMIADNAPIRFGLLPLVKEERNILSTGDILSRVTFYLFYKVSKRSAADFVARVISTKIFAMSPESSLAEVMNFFADNYPAVGSEEFLSRNSNSWISVVMERARKKTEKFDLGPTDHKAFTQAMFINGIFVEVTSDFQTDLMGVVEQLFGNIQRLLYTRQLSESQDIYAFFLRALNAKRYRNPLLIPRASQKLVVVEPPATSDENIHYFSKHHDIYKFTLWIYGNMSLPSFSRTIANALKYLNNDLRSSRISFFNIGGLHSEFSTWLRDDLTIAMGGSEFELYGQSFTSAEVADLVTLSTRASKVFRDSEPGSFVVVNGRVLGPVAFRRVINEDDIGLLLEDEWAKTKNVFEHFTSFPPLHTPLELADKYLLSLIASYRSMSKHQSSGLFATSEDSLVRRDIVTLLYGENCSFSSGSGVDSRLSVVTIVDPIDANGQKIISILDELSSLKGLLSSRVYLNPSRLEGSELPIKRFYRFALDWEFRDAAQSIEFFGLPAGPLFTLSLDVPQSWVVASVSASHDLDNIKVDSVTSSEVIASFQLESLLVEGCAIDISIPGPPRGLQLTLGNSHTIVMANLGYFQFTRTSIGMGNIELLDGRSRELYDMIELSVDNTFVKPLRGGFPVSVRNFEGSFLSLKVEKKASHLKDDVLESDTASSSVFSLWKSWFSKSQGSGSDIHIFSVASGHLYERFLRIMMYSVMKTTTHSVKFWIIENFLSPQFKASLPKFALKLKFDFELITFKWPEWLRKQSEKQRTIWGYKILFLDVIFPLSLEKVIFVDADQIVRADLKELMDIDLQGAPYGYTPFCNSREETAGFRFWESGYWKDHLRGKPYHISAIYVVDLKKFRQIAAGDIIRQQYQALTVDPNSLSNLDQDLPNYLQHSLPIFSLPQTWLYCQTWCDDESLSKAKTIDLCNNPLTKEPKLDLARRLIPEWSTYDEAVKDILNDIRQEKDVIHNDL